MRITTDVGDGQGARMRDSACLASRPTQRFKAVRRLGTVEVTLATQATAAAALGTQGMQVVALVMQGMQVLVAALEMQGMQVLVAALGMQGMYRQAASRKGRANVVASGALRRVLSS